MLGRSAFIMISGVVAAILSHGTLAFNVETSVIIDSVDAPPIIVVGYPFSVWKRDGPSLVWQQLPVSNEVPSRQRFAGIAFKTFYYIIGGQPVNETSAAFRDVWRSKTGESWTCIVSSAPWSPRHNVSVANIDSQLVLFGGECDSGPCDDAWSSWDGSEWFPYAIESGQGGSLADDAVGPLCLECGDERTVGIHCPLCVTTSTAAVNCSGHGTFHANNGTCTCDVGWAGANCSACADSFFGPDCLPCDGQTVSSNGTFLACNGHGVCDGSGTHAGKGTCTCDYNWGGGLTCSYCTNFFAGDQCQQCDPGFWGPFCKPCPGFILWEGIWCSGHGVCSGSGTQTGNGSCVCDPLWDGDFECSTCSSSRGGLDCTGCALNYWGPHCDACPGYVPFYVPSCNEHGNCQGTGTTGGNGTCVCDAPFTGPTCSDCMDGYWGIVCNPCPALNRTTGVYCSGHGACTDHGTCACDRGFDLWNCSQAVPEKPSNGHQLHPAAIALIAVGCVVLVVVVWQSVVVYKRTKAANSGLGVDTSMFLVTSAEEPDLDVGSQKRRKLTDTKYEAPEFSSR